MSAKNSTGASYISILEPVSRAKSQLGVSHATEDVYFIHTAIEAIKRIGTTQTYVPMQERLRIDNLTAELPCGFHSLKALRLLDDGSCEYPKFDRKHFWKCSEDCPNATEKAYTKTFTINGQEIYFSSDVDAEECEISYLGFNTDESGFPLVYANHEYAIKNFICYQYAVKDFKRFPASIRRDYEQQWRENLATVRAKDAALHEAEWDYIARIYHSMLPLPSTTKR